MATLKFAAADDYTLVMEVAFTLIVLMVILPAVYRSLRSMIDDLQQLPLGSRR